MLGRRREAQASWTCVGRDQQYTPSADDVGSILRVRAEPPPAFDSSAAVSAASTVLSKSVEAVGVVESPPERLLLVPRVRSMAQIRELVREAAHAAAADPSTPAPLTPFELAAAINLTAAAADAASSSADEPANGSTATGFPCALTI